MANANEPVNLLAYLMADNMNWQGESLFEAATFPQRYHPCVAHEGYVASIGLLMADIGQRGTVAPIL